MECLIESGRKIVSCTPCKGAEDSLIRQALNEHPQLAYSIEYITMVPEEYILDVLPPRWAPRFWDILSQIPYGETVSYAEFTALLGLSNGYTRVVGTQLSWNKHFLLLPCHRVIRSDYTIGGYKWGIALKRKLLDYERNGQANGFK